MSRLFRLKWWLLAAVLLVMVGVGVGSAVLVSADIGDSSTTNTNVSLPDEDCGRVVTGGVNKLRWGTDGVWVTCSSGQSYTSLISEDSNGIPLTNLKDGISLLTRGDNGETIYYYYVWDDTHVWRVQDIRDVKNTEEMTSKFTLVSGLTGGITKVVSGSKDPMMNTETIVYGTDGVWLVDENSNTTTKVSITTHVNDVFFSHWTGFWFATTDDGVWVFDTKGNIRKITDPDTGITPTGKIIGFDFRQNDFIFYGEQGLWVAECYDGDLDTGDFEVSLLTSESVTSVSPVGVTFSLSGLIYLTKSGLVRFMYKERGIFQEGSIEGGEITNATTLFGSGDSVVVANDNNVWLLSHGYVDFQDGSGSYHYMASTLISEITGKVIGISEAMYDRNYGFVAVTTDGVWVFDDSGKVVPPHFLPERLLSNWCDGKKVQCFLPHVAVVTKTMTRGSDDYFVDKSGNPILINGEKIKAFPLTKFVESSIVNNYSGYVVYGDGKYYFKQTDKKGDSPVEPHVLPVDRQPNPIFHVSFDLNEANGQSNASTTPPVQALESGSLAVKPSDPTWENRHFAGWFVKNDDGSWGNEWDFNTPVTSDVTLYAKWQVKQSFESMIPECDLEATTYYVRTRNYGVSADGALAPTCNDYDFIGWLKNDSSSTDVITDLSKVSLTEDTVFYAKWQPKEVRLSFRKVDANDNTKHLAGAEFTIIGGSLMDPLVVTSDKDGMVHFTVPVSSSHYTVTEVVAPAGYEDALKNKITSFELFIPSTRSSDITVSNVQCSGGSVDCLSKSNNSVFEDKGDSDNSIPELSNEPNEIVLTSFPKTGFPIDKVAIGIAITMIAMAITVVAVSRKRSRK